MVDEQPNLGTEARQLAQTILAILESLVQAAATLAPPGDAEPGKCQQIWCPVCAVAAVAVGEQHPLAAIIAEHGATLLGLIRTMVNQDEPSPSDGSTPAHHADWSTNAPGRYQPITVTVHE